ncbi:MAG: ribose 5-phosphate isomerase B [Peptoniphilaceae bacterium]|uniref:ribose 5-phosphate isomerase B n=1 Tax=Parvimonas sp. TaxID=1944660 RepID=UPI0025F28B57|nr:ribose 5-phosphate isomerase B [Parvimonas sp.]MCI5996834.1 ribose 5-phosphate isomerase B [Parvimonas sp.]MDD7764744.1 ribose 5-phosphate isomerase B [Peptoniphilaceae bacterium]MDY3050786.1 ribose 5-phosphate isomerase B [Parvimonas sp.]
MKIIIGNDHSAVEMKNEIIKFLEDLGHEVENVGTNDHTSVDYPVFARKVCKKVLENKDSLGIAICGTGIGISIACNKVKGIRAALCSENFSAKMTRKHNNANVLCLGARVTGIELAKDIVKTFIDEKFEGGRHQKRIDMLEEE